MKVGDLVKRADIWQEWRKTNSWIDVSKEVGIILARTNSAVLEIYWPTAGLQLEDEVHLEIVNESR